VNPSVIVHIDVLNVEGMNPSQAATLGREFETALARLIESGGMPRALARSGERPLMELAAPGGLQGTGATLAEILYRRLDE